MSFEENATLKALAMSKKLPGFVVADDSGLEVDAFGRRARNLFGSLCGGERDRERKDKQIIAEACASWRRRRRASGSISLRRCACAQRQSPWNI